MTIVYLSNYFNHHQSSVSDAFYDLTGGNYYFVETTPIPEFRIRLGYKKLYRPYVLKYEDNCHYVDDLIITADVVIHGEAPIRLIKKRVRMGKLTFHDNERRYKSWIKYLKWPIYTYNSLTLNKCYLLCSSAFASRDFALSGMNPKKCYKWGYFPQVENMKLYVQKNSELGINSNVRIMWCGRFINLKHPELPIMLAARLKKDGYGFVLNMFGSGEEMARINSLANAMNVCDVVNFRGSMPNDEILSQMCNHDIFLFTSDQNEGWGAVLNEAMWCGCAVVASHAIGAVPYLIKDGINGLIFKSEDGDSLYEKVSQLIADASFREKISHEAQLTMKKTWCARNASKNFIQLCEALMNGKGNPIIDGPCSSASIMNNNWM